MTAPAPLVQQHAFVPTTMSTSRLINHAGSSSASATAPTSAGGRPPSASSAGGATKKSRARPSISAGSNYAPLPDPSSPPGGGGGEAIDLTKVRAYAACRNCRTKKIKCLPSTGPGGLPAASSSLENPNVPGPCQQCVQAGLECTYPPTRDRAAYSRQYVQNLEARVQALEMMNQRVVPLLDAFERGEPFVPPSSAHTTTYLSRPMTTPGEEGVPKRELDEHDQQHQLEVPFVEHAGDVSGEVDELADGDDDEDGPQSDLDGDGHMAQDERGNVRWIGPSNTLSLLSSFGRRNSDRATKESSTTSHLHYHQHHHHPLAPPDSAESRSDNPYFAPVAGSGVVKVLPGVDEVSYPPDDRAAEMIDAFFAEVHPCLPVVIEHDFRAEYKVLQEKREKRIELKNQGFVSMLFAMFALGERVLVTSKAWQRERAKMVGTKTTEGEEDETVLPGEAEAGVIWYERAQILHYTTLKDVDICQVQCLTLMASFQAAVNAMPMSWLLAGQAIRVAQDLGLHRSTGRMRIPYAERQLRSRVWWSIYGLERTVSISLGRPLGVDDLDVDVAYPAVIDDEGLLRVENEGMDSASIENTQEPAASVMSGFVALTKLCKIAGKVAHVLYRPLNGRNVQDPNWAASQQKTIDKLDKLLRDWLETEVPSKYKDPSSITPVQLLSAVLSNTYFAIRITLHRNFLPPDPSFPRPKPPPSSQSLSHCVDAARSSIHIAAQSRVLLPPTHHMAVFCQYLWSSAVILLLCEVRAREQVVVDAVDSQVDAAKRTLRALEPVWPGCRKLKELLVDVESRAKEVAVAVGTVKQTGRASTGKKRKGSGQDALPAAGDSGRAGSQGQTWQYAPMTAALDAANKRARMQVGNYETSDTRTLVRDESEAPPHSAQSYHQTGPLQTLYNMGPSQHPTPMQTPVQATGHAGATATTTTNFELFDVGGVTFNGLDMLQGFTGDMASFWASLGEPFVPPTPGGSQLASGGAMTISSSSQYQAGHRSTTGGGYAVSTTGGTPSSTGMGPSPSANWQQQFAASASGNGPPNNTQNTTPGGSSVPLSASAGTQSHQQSPVQAMNGSGGILGVGGLVGGGEGATIGEDFWNQVTGGQFDWGADPNVPFNI